MAKMARLDVFKKNIELVVAVSLLVSMTFFFFGPMEIFLSEPAEFWFSISDIIGLIVLSTAACFLIVFVILLLVSFLGENVFYVIASVLAAVGLGLYIQGNWTFVGYGSMDGTPIDWSSYSAWAVIDTVIWIVILAAVIILFCMKRKLIKIYSGIMFGIVGIELITLGILAVSSIGAEKKIDYSLTGGDEFMLSANNPNILVIIADGYDGSAFLPVLEEEPELGAYFDGFTFYEDTVGTSYFSEESGITLLTGNQFETGLSFQENVAGAYRNSSLYDILENENYSTYLYLNMVKMVSSDIGEQIENYSSSRSQLKDYSSVFRMIYKMVAFRYMPHILKKQFWYSSAMFHELKEDSKSCVYMNYDMYDILQDQGISASYTDGGVYQLFWIQGPHTPVNTDRYCHKLDSITDTGADGYYTEGQFEQTIGVTRLFTEIITKLKEAGIYDNTTVIFTADHGWSMRPNPLLLIKPADAHGDLVVSDTPVSMIEDYIPTLEYYITGSKEYGNTIYDYSEGQERERPLYVYDINTSDRTYNSRTEVSYPTQAFSNEVKLGRRYTSDKFGVLASYGFSYGESLGVWTNGTSSELVMNLDEAYHNLQLDLNWSRTYREQEVKVYANDQLVADYRTDGGGDKSIIIPGEYVEDGSLVLRFEFPNAVAPADVDVNSGDSRVLAVCFTGMELSDTNDEWSPDIQLEN